MQNEGPSVVWFDDYYVQSIDERTFAIGETRYFQQNFNYLIVGEERAILAKFDECAAAFVPSHLHYDHVGNGVDFGEFGAPSTISYAAFGASR